ncbi:hypothetical protein GGS20DRAFT_358533 [Poronia punctata]|nr:hypothetical protein GGS20DRAFT_358533 [Poronia punctata]
MGGDLPIGASRPPAIQFSQPFVSAVEETRREIGPAVERPPWRRASSAWLPRNISTMDGPSSQYPPTFVNSLTNADHPLPTPFDPRRSTKDSALGIDPPRPAKEGYEWVWFPAGYWAERKVSESQPKDPIKGFRWRTRSGKSSSDREQSPKTPVPSPLAAKRGEKSSELTPKAPRTTASSESGSSSVRHHSRLTDAGPLTSPYLTEEAHVQSLQWPSIDAARNRSLSGSSIMRLRAAATPLPLHFSSSEESKETDNASTAPELAVDHQYSNDIPADTYPLESARTGTEVDAERKSKKLSISWRMLGGNHRLLPKKRESTHQRSPLSQDQETSQPGADSQVTEESPKSLKGLSVVRLWTKSAWRRRVSGSSVTSTSSSLQEESTATANIWDSEYPGGEAIRILTPNAVGVPIERPPRSFFPQLSPPARGVSPRSRQDEPPGPKEKPTLFASVITGASSSSSTLGRRARRKEHSPKNTNVRTSYSGSDRSTIRDQSKGKAATNGQGAAPSNDGKVADKAKSPKWWEESVSTPSAYEAIHRVMATNTMLNFAFEIPEHSPTSPMCPANKRHKASSAAVCVYHGRAKLDLTSSRASRQDTQAGLSPGIAKKEANSSDREGKAAGRNEDATSGDESDPWYE